VATVMRRRKAKQTALALGEAKRSDSEVYYLVGGWRGNPKYISEPLLCRHDHGRVEPETMARLVPKCLVPKFFSRRCLTAEWMGHPAGMELLVYGTPGINAKLDVWVRL
jgi:hypothetical protein